MPCNVKRREIFIWWQENCNWYKYQSKVSTCHFIIANKSHTNYIIYSNESDWMKGSHCCYCCCCCCWCLLLVWLMWFHTIIIDSQSHFVELVFEFLRLPSVRKSGMLLVSKLNESHLKLLSSRKATSAK